MKNIFNIDQSLINQLMIYLFMIFKTGHFIKLQSCIKKFLKKNLTTYIIGRVTLSNLFPLSSQMLTKDAIPLWLAYVVVADLAI